MVAAISKIACIAPNQTPLDWDGNLERIIHGIHWAEESRADVVLFPELSLTAYSCQDYFFHQNVLQRSLEQLEKIIKLSAKLVIVVGLPVKFENKLYNCAAIIDHGVLLGIKPKRVLAQSGVYYEPRWFSAWQVSANNSNSKVDLCGQNVDFGDRVYQTKSGWMLGVEICEEAWKQSLPDPLKKVDLVASIHASHFEMHKQSKRLQLVKHRSQDTKGIYAYCNAHGLESGRLIFGGEVLLAQHGKMIYEGENLQINTICKHIYDSAKSKSYQSIKSASPYQDFTDALCLGLHDYLKKSKHQGFALSLSGGLDSAATAILVHRMYQKIQQNIKLHCVYQKTKQNSDKTNSLAKQLANSLGAEYSSVDISEVIDSYQKLNQTVFGEKLSFEENGLSLQNLQSRVRNVLPWTIANEKKYLLLTTSNRSESAVGYCTMDGDTAGGLAPIAGVSKYFLQNWAKWAIDQEWSAAYSDVLLEILKQKPSAELLPQSQNQTDEADLMPYPILDFFERQMFLKRLQTVEELLAEIPTEFISYSDQDLRVWASRYLKLWSQSQWKRERIAPSFHLDEFSLDPKSWARYPILIGDS